MFSPPNAMGMLLIIRGRLAAALLASALLLAGCGGDSSGGESVSGSVSEQLAYLEPDSSVVAAVDLRFGEENWKHLQALISRGLREYRNIDPESAVQVPPNLNGALDQLAGSAGLDFEEDLQPLLDGYLVVGQTVEPAPAEVQQNVPDQGEAPLEPRQTTVFTYRTESDGLRRVVEKLAGGDKLRPVPGQEDALLVDSSTAVVGDNTLVNVDSSSDQGEGPAGKALTAALERGKGDGGYPAGRLDDAQEQTGSEDPLVLATGNLDLGGLLVNQASLDRARAEVPLLAAIRGIATTVDIEEDKLSGAVRITTEAGELTDEDVPLGPSGPVELPVKEDAVVGGSRNQSMTTAFATKLARSLFADSRFVRAVESTESKLGIDFEQEFLRQFDCPSVSVFEGPETQEFAARSCVSDPARMRRLLPRLTPELPRIITALQALESEGLLALLLIAPDAPLTPSFGGVLGAVDVKPLGKGGGEEQLYELRGLQDPDSRLAFPGPDRVVFGMIGDDFVVGSDREGVRDVAEIETEKYGRDAASATRVPAAIALGATDGPESRLAERLIEELSISASGDRSGIEIDLELPFANR